MASAIPSPSGALPAQLRYRITPRPRPNFRTILDAHDFLDTASHLLLRFLRQEAKLGLQLSHQLAQGGIEESFSFETRDGALVSTGLLREVFESEGRRIRHEECVFDGTAIVLPEGSYPETVLPFILGWLPQDGRTRSLVAWTNDRFVARVYVEGRGATQIRIGGAKRAAYALIMYPDLNDWVPLPKLVSRLSKPFLPKYQMWFDPEPPHALLRFEGSQGPPGAPELILELEPG